MVILIVISIMYIWAISPTFFFFSWRQILSNACNTSFLRTTTVKVGQTIPKPSSDLSFFQLHGTSTELRGSLICPSLAYLGVWGLWGSLPYWNWTEFTLVHGGRKWTRRLHNSCFVSEPWVSASHRGFGSSQTNKAISPEVWLTSCIKSGTRVIMSGVTGVSPAELLKHPVPKS